MSEKKKNLQAILTTSGFWTAIGLILTALILGGFYAKKYSANDSIYVVGLSERSFTSDLIVWSGSFSTSAPDLKDAYASLGQNRELVKRFWVDNGIPEADVVFSAVDIQREYETYWENERSRSVFKGYRLSQSVSIESSNVDQVEKLARQVTELINQGVEIYSDQPQYFYTKLAELKLEMIGEASADARTRAERIAQESKTALGHLKMADMGVFQIVAENSSEEYSWGGAFNTLSKRKTATITMRLTFAVD